MVKVSRWHRFVTYLLITLLTLPTLSCGSIAQLFKKPPNAPSELFGQADSHTKITIQWADNSDNEDGFKVFRNGVPIATLEADRHVFHDSGLQYSTTYRYSVSAFNDKGETASESATNIKTLNPPLVITIDRIGVIKDHDPWPRGAGDIYMYLAISDGQSQPQIIRIPSSGTITLNDGESKVIQQQVFSTYCVGDELKFVAVAFESDNPILGIVGNLLLQGLTAYLTAQYGQAGMLVGALIKSQPSTSDEGPPMELAESTSDDFVGAIERTSTVSENWGIGSHGDVKNGDLRLWFTISIPGETAVNPQQPSAPNYPTVTAKPPGVTLVPVPTNSAPPQPTITINPPPVSAPPSTITVKPAVKPLSVSFNGWFMDGVQVTTATKGKTVIARFTVTGGTSGQYKIVIRRDIRWAGDQTVAEVSFNHDGSTVTKDAAFTAVYATDESSTDGYHADLLLGTSSVWTMTNSYPPRLRVKK